MFETRSDLDTAFTQAGLARFAAPVARLCVPALALVDDAAADAAKVGQSRLGGAPDLPADIAWPIHAPYHRTDEELTGRRATMRETFTTAVPLHFIAQIDLDGVARTGALKPFPESGRLLLFWDPKGGPWIDSAASCRVIHDRSPVSALTRRAAPADLGKPDPHFDMPPLFAAKPVGFLPTLSMPDRWLLRDLAMRAGEQALLDSLEDPDWEGHWERLWEQLDMRGQLASGRRVLPHRLGGWPIPVQSDPRYAAAESALGIGARPTEADQAKADAARHAWVMLAQIDLDAFSNAFADGTIYFVMREADLKAANFERVHAIYQQT
jgi:Domain of unknown function (DUF1963)